MSAGIVVAIVLCLVGILKLPFKSFKEKYPQVYKAVFTIVSVAFCLGLSVLNEIYILNGKLISIEFLNLVCIVIGGVFSGYNGFYEGLGLKELVKTIVENVKKAKELATEKNVIKYLNGIEDIDKAIKLLEERKNNNKNGEV